MKTSKRLVGISLGVAQTPRLVVTWPGRNAAAFTTSVRRAAASVRIQSRKEGIGRGRPFDSLLE